MAKRKIIRKSNKPFTANANYYGLGDELKKLFKSAGTALSSGDFINAGAGMAGDLIGALSAGGLESGAGKVLGGVGDAVGNIPVIGGIGKLAFKGLSALTDGLFGSKINQEKVDALRNEFKGLNTLNVDTSSFDAIENQWGSQNFGSEFSRSDIGRDGLFSNKAKNLYNKLQVEQDAAQNRALLAYANAVSSVDTQNDLNVLSNFMASGGPIHIKPSKRGTFTAAAKKHGKSVQAFASQVLANKENYSPAMVKKANFARNAAKWHHANGGFLSTNGADWSNGITIIGNGSTHEENPMEGVQIGVDPQGIPNLVEEGEVIFDDYVFSNRLTVPKAVRKKYKLRGNKDITFADAAKQMQKESEERPNDPISKRGLEDSMMRLMASQEDIRKEKGVSDNNRFDDGGWTKYLRYAPVLGSAIGLGQNLFSSPDYSSADAIKEEAERAGTYTPVSYDPIGNYLTYTPFDRNYYLNKLNAQASATRRAIMNTSSPSRNASLLASDYNTQTKMGELARQAEEYNLAQRQAVETFNRATNQANAEMGLKTAMANAEGDLAAKKLRLTGITEAMTRRDTIDARRSTALSANLTNLFDNLGNVGTDIVNREDRDFLIKSGVYGILPMEKYAKLYPKDALTEARRRGYSDDEIKALGIKFKCGGKLNKKRGGFTY